MWVVSIIDINTVSIISMNWSKIVNCVYVTVKSIQSVQSVQTGKTANRSTVKIVKTVITVKSVKTGLTGERFVKTYKHLVFSFIAIPNY